MINKFTKTMVIGFIAILVLSLGAVSVFAQDDTTPDTDAVPTMPFGRGGFGGFGGHHGHHGFGGGDEEAMAEALGITVEELQAARQKLMADRLAQAVEDGTLTQEQADSMLAMQAVKAYIDHGAILAEALGMTVEELEAAREDGTLYDILSNITPAELHAQMQAAMESAVQQAVADGAITQAQADLIAEQIASGAGMMGRFGGRGGFGGHHGFNGFRTPLPDDAGNSAFSTAFGA
jgi:hypothetical protein